jgi:hypothetical protein
VVLECPASQSRFGDKKGWAEKMFLRIVSKKLSGTLGHWDSYRWGVFLKVSPTRIGSKRVEMET